MAGYTGKKCEEDIDECALNLHRCDSKGTRMCFNTPGSYLCYCKNEYLNPNFLTSSDEQTDDQKFCQEKYDACLSNPCKNSGECIHNNGNFNKFSCLCPSKFTGKFCEISYDSCKSNPCLYGKCVLNKLQNSDEEIYSCLCQPGYTGTNCEIEADECQSNPCKTENTLSCKDHFNRFECQCKPGFEGLYCQKMIDYCRSFPCHFGTCQMDQRSSGVNNEFTCNCDAGKTGKLCESEIDDCLSNPCQNHGICQDLGTENREV